MNTHSEGYGVNRARLRDMCKVYKLPYSGKMELLRERLRAFSKRRELWEQ